MYLLPLHVYIYPVSLHKPGVGGGSLALFFCCAESYFIFFTTSLGNKLYYESFFFLKEKRFLECVLWSEVFLGSERVPGRETPRLTSLEACMSVAKNTAWSPHCSQERGTVGLVLVMCVWTKWQLMFEHLMYTWPYSELFMLRFT